MSETVKTQGQAAPRQSSTAEDPATGATPDSVQDASSLFREGVSDRTTLRFSGNGTKAGWGGTADQVDVEVSTAHLQGLISHEPGDMTAAAQAGMPLAELQTLLGEHGQWLALDPATEASGATLGGLLASGEAGPRRLRYGTMRDLAIGATLVLADGTVVHSGSHVIKNVAGYDLTKLFHGSLGSLGLVAEVIVRLHPRPPESSTVMAEASVARASAAAQAVTSCGVEPTAVEWIGPTDEDPAGTLLVRLDGSKAGVAAGVDRVTALLTTLGLAPELLRGSDADQQWAIVTERVRAPADGSAVRAGTLPTRLIPVAEGLTRLAEQHGVEARLVSSAALGLHTAVLTGPPSAQAAVIAAWRAQVRAVGGLVTVRDRPTAVEAECDVLGPPPSAVALLRAVKKQLDPDDRCAPGRFRGWY